MPYFIIYGKRKWRKSLLYERQGLINRRLAGLNERLKLADRKQDSNHRAVSPNKGEHLRGGDSAWGHPNVKSVKNLHVDPVSRLTKTFGLKAAGERKRRKSGLSKRGRASRYVWSQTSVCSGETFWRFGEVKMCDSHTHTFNTHELFNKIVFFLLLHKKI